MFLIQRLNCASKSSSIVNLTRAFCDTTKTASNSLKTQQEVKPFKSMPSLSLLKILLRFLPGGKYHNAGTMDLQKSVLAEFGGIVRVPGIESVHMPPMVLTHDPRDFETVFRNDGVHPERYALHTLQYFRKNLRPDVYGEYGGLVCEQGECWHKFRSLVNPIVAKPQTVKLYIPQVDEIVRDFIKL